MYKYISIEILLRLLQGRLKPLRHNGFDRNNAKTKVCYNTGRSEDDENRERGMER